MELKSGLIGAMSKVIIRIWTLTDLPTIRDIAWRTWLATYSSFIPDADLRWFLDEYYSDAALTKLFRDETARTFIAEGNAAAAGFSKTYLNKDDRKFYVASLYVLPGFQGKGIGGELMRASEEHARTFGVNEVWLGVMEQNVAALEWYKKLGFQFVQEAPFRMGKTTVNHLIGFKKLNTMSQE
jgi:ribosomal protein S18 acetylase RimI-like enzyme